MLVFAAALAVSTVAEAVVKAVVGLKIVKFLLFWSFRMMKILFDLQEKYKEKNVSSFSISILNLYHIFRSAIGVEILIEQNVNNLDA